MVVNKNKISLQWRYNERDGISNQRHHDCLLKRLFRRRSKKASKFRVTGLCEGNSPVTGDFPTQRTGNAENVSIWWRHPDPDFAFADMEQVSDSESETCFISSNAKSGSFVYQDVYQIWIYQMYQNILVFSITFYCQIIDCELVEHIVWSFRWHQWPHLLSKD